MPSADADLRADDDGVDSSPHRRALWFALIVAGVLFVFTHSTIQCENDLSRFLAVESLALRGQWHADGSAHCRLVPRADGTLVRRPVDLAYNRRDGHFYSSKPPVFSLMQAAVVRGLNGLGAGLTFVGPQSTRAVFLLTWLFIGVPTACAFYAFRRALGRELPPSEADLATALTLGSTLFLTYSTVMNHHTFTATLVLISFFLLRLHRGERSVPALEAAAAGLLLGLAAMVDIGPGVAFATGFGLYLVFYVRSLRAVMAYGLGSLPPMAAHCVVQWRLWGTVLPVQMIRGTMDYPHSYWRVPLGADALDLSRAEYWFYTLFSMRGLIVLTPLLLVGAGVLVHTLLRPASPEGEEAGAPWLQARGRAAGRAYAAATVAFGVVFLLAYYWLVAPMNFGGDCYGFRWFIGFTPLLAWYAALGYARWHRSRPFRTVFFALAAVSMLYGLIGLRGPWEPMEELPHPAVRVLRFLPGPW